MPDARGADIEVYELTNIDQDVVVVDIKGIIVAGFPRSCLRFLAEGQGSAHKPSPERYSLQEFFDLITRAWDDR